MKLALLVALFALAGCPNLVVRSPRNAPGHVDLATPPAHETGDPASFEPAGDPGEYRSMVLPGAYVGFGEGRRWGATELGAQLRVTFAESYDQSAARDDFPFVWSAWGAAFGWGIAQISNSDTMPTTTIGGPMFAEVNRTWSVCGVGAGVAVYPRDPEVGPQLSAWAGPVAVRARYMTDTGFEIFAGYQLELPTVWIWSR
jgi:hypothetical protein